MQTGLSTIAARFLKPFLALGDEHLAGLGLEQVDFGDPEARVDYAVAVQVFEVARRVSGRDDQGVIGAIRDAGTLRILAYMSRVSRTPLDALQKVARYQNLMHDACLFTLEHTGSSVIAHMGSRAKVPFPAVLVDFFMTSLVMGLYRLGVPSEGARVSFIHAAPRDPSQFEAAFRCPLRFEAESNSARFPLSGLTAPLPDADPALCAVLELHAERMLDRLPQGAPLLDTLRAWVAQHLVEGDLGLANAAAKLGLSDRTLRRRLRAEGVTFQGVIDEVRAQLAGDYLDQTDLAVEEVAFLLGFSEASAFRRAYQRWHGRHVPPRRTLAARQA